MKRKYVCPCHRPSRGASDAAVQLRGQRRNNREKAYEYLASQYSAEFTIISAKREADGPVPLPDLNPSCHWVLTVMSGQFPDETFVMRCLRTNGKNWRLLDDYFTLLLREETTNYFYEIIAPYLNTPYIVKIL